MNHIALAIRPLYLYISYLLLLLLSSIQAIDQCHLNRFLIETSPPSPLSADDGKMKMRVTDTTMASAGLLKGRVTCEVIVGETRRQPTIRHRPSCPVGLRSVARTSVITFIEIALFCGHSFFIL